MEENDVKSIICKGFVAVLGLDPVLIGASQWAAGGGDHD
jgi:hypothetical protein